MYVPYTNEQPHPKHSAFALSVYDIRTPDQHFFIALLNTYLEKQIHKEIYPKKGKVWCYMVLQIQPGCLVFQHEFLCMLLPESKNHSQHSNVQ